MDAYASCPVCRRGACRAHAPRGVSVSSGKVPRHSVGRLVRSATMIFALITLAAWWDYGSTTSGENVLVTHPDKIMVVALSADGRWLASGGYQGSVLIWDMARRKVESDQEGERGPVFGLDWSRDGSSLAAVRFDGTVTVWDTKAWEVRKEFQA